MSDRGSTEGRAKLILLQVRLCLSGRIAEKRIGVEDVVAHELPGVTVEILLAALGYQGRARDLRAIEGIVLRSVDFQLGDGVRVGHGAGSVGAVQSIGAGARVAIHVHAARAPAERAGVVHVRRRAR